MRILAVSSTLSEENTTSSSESESEELEELSEEDS
jgi:hypothetical protein